MSGLIELCCYGCGSVARYKFKNGKMSCSKSKNSCIEVKKKLKQAQQNANTQSEVKERRSKAQKIAQNRLEVREKRSKALKISMNKTDTKQKIALSKDGKTWEEIFGQEKAKELKIRMSERLKGRKRPDHSEKMKGDRNPTKQLEVREKISRSNKISLNKPEVKEKMSGSNHHSWNPDRDEVCKPYTEKFYDEYYRELIREQQKCIDPITREFLTNSSILHHIDYNKQNDTRENLIYLNRCTHTKTNYNRKKWEILLLEINKNIIESIAIRG